MEVLEEREEGKVEADMLNKVVLEEMVLDTEAVDMVQGMVAED